MACFKMGQCCIWLPDRAGVYNVAIISVQPLLSAVHKIQALAFCVMASFKIYYEQDKGTCIMNSSGLVVMCVI
jgi:hypothetical protein